MPPAAISYGTFGCGPKPTIVLLFDRSIYEMHIAQYIDLGGIAQ